MLSRFYDNMGRCSNVITTGKMSSRAWKKLPDISFVKISCQIFTNMFVKISCQIFRNKYARFLVRKNKLSNIYEQGHVRKNKLPDIYEQALAFYWFVKISC